MIRRHAAPPRRRFSVLFLWFLLPLLGLYVLYRTVVLMHTPIERTTVLLLTEPVEVVSYNPAKEQWVIVQFDPSTHISGIHGLGEYALDSLWELAATESSPSAIVLGSLSDELGIPIDYYLGDSNKRWQPTELFGLSGVIDMISNKYETNIPVPLYTTLNRLYRTSSAHKKTTIRVSESNGLMQKKLADHSVITVFDRPRFDAITSDLFEDQEIREERMKISVFNTTTRPFLGSRVARIIDRLGGHVIEVDTEPDLVSECQVIGTKEKLETKTAITIKQLFRCDTVEKNETGRSDLLVKIGREYEQRFTPRPLHQ